MLTLEQSPLFGKLSRVELARLLPEVQEVGLSPGEYLAMTAGEPYLYIVRDGRLELVTRSGDEEMVLVPLQEGDTIGQESLTGRPPAYQTRAVTTATLYKIPASRVNMLLEQNPGLARELLQVTARQLALAQQEVVQAKTGLLSYSRELWSTVDEEIAAGQATLPSRLASRRDSATRFGPDPWVLLHGLRGAGFISSLLAGGAAFLLLHAQGWERAAAVTAAVLVWAVVNWAFDSMPDYVVAVAAVAIVAAAGAVSVPIALSGFANSTWMLSLAILGIGIAIVRSGLLFRTALHMLKLLPATYWGQCLALGLSGLLLTPVLPSPSGRVAIAGPLAIELSRAMRLPDRSRGSAGLSMSVLLGFGQMYFLFLNGTGTSILLWSLLPPQVRSEVNWGFWFLAALPLGLFVFGTSYAAIMWLLRPEQPVTVSQRVLREQLKTLGPVSRLEWITMSVVVSVLGAFITQPLHGIDPTWTAVAGLLYLIAVGIIDRESFRQGVDWNFLMLYGGLIGLVSILDQTGVTPILSAQMTPLFRPLLVSPLIFLLVVALATTVLRIFMPMVTAPLLMAITLYPLADSAGISPFAVALAVQVASYPWFLPHQNPFYQTLVATTEGRSFTHPQVRPLGLLYAFLTVVSIAFAYPFWRWLHLV